MGKAENVPFGGNRVTNSCLGCKFFMTSTSLCGKNVKGHSPEFVDNPSKVTCESYKMDRYKMPK